ncbi:MinD/ParA family protein [Clostridium sp. DL1XJH146]
MIDQAQNLREMVFSKDKLAKPSENKILIYTIASGKGGVGKSNFTLNLAIGMQNRGRSVLIIDADYGMANINVLLGVRAKKTLYDVINKNIPLKEVIIESTSGIKIISGGSGLLEMAEMGGTRQRKLLNDLSQLEGIDTILVDTSAGVSKSLLSFISFSQDMILVTTPEPTSLADAYSLIKIVNRMKVKDSIKVVVNKVSNEEDSIKSFEKLERVAANFLSIRLDEIGFIIEDKKVKEAVMGQNPFIIEYPKCMASKNINNIIDTLLSQNSDDKGINSMKQLINRMIKVFS